MTMIKTMKFAGIVFASFLLIAPKTYGVCPEPGMGEQVVAPPPGGLTDPLRNTTGAVLSLISMSEHPKQLAKIIAHQQEVGALIDGEESYQKEEGTGSGSSDMEITAYDYVKAEVFGKEKYTPYTKLNNKIKPYMTSGRNRSGSSGDNTAQFTNIIKEEFFIANATDDTPEKRAQVQANRDKYLRTLGREYVRLAYNVQDKLSTDANTVTADINGDGSIGVVSGVDQGWKAVNKALIVDLVLQIEMMELEAARFLSVQPIVVMPNPGTSS